jgi:mannosyltransferase OCH1-like enzyme
MLLLRQLLPSKFFNYFILLALCAVVFLYQFWTIGSTRFVQLQHARPQKPDEIPKIIWYKLGPSGLNNDTRQWTNSCIDSNPDYRVEFLTDEAADDYVKTAFASRPDILESYLSLTVPILKADLLRYLLLFDQGGIWFDLDISCEGIPIDEWVAPQYRNDAGLVVGWEFDVGWKKPFVHQFASWTIMAKPGSLHMLQVIEEIVQTLREKMYQHKVTAENITLAMVGDVVDFSGPRRLTFGVLKSLGKTLNRTVKPDEISELEQPMLVGDVLVMPGRSFAASANRYKAEDEEKLPPKLVTHHYAGTWKNDQGGESV